MDRRLANANKNAKHLVSKDLYRTRLIEVTPNLKSLNIGVDRCHPAVTRQSSTGLKNVLRQLDVKDVLIAPTGWINALQYPF
jgi:hypothetical protein